MQAPVEQGICISDTKGIIFKDIFKDKDNAD